jgi:hypothetical protein
MAWKNFEVCQRLREERYIFLGYYERLPQMRKTTDNAEDFLCYFEEEFSEDEELNDSDQGTEAKSLPNAKVNNLCKVSDLAASNRKFIIRSNIFHRT